MKEIIRLMAAASVAAMTIYGCHHEINDSYSSTDEVLNVHATLEEIPETKTSLNGKDIFWSSDDEIAVFINNTLRKRFKITAESEGSKNATFLYDSDYIITGSNVQISNNIAYYPFCDATCTPDEDSYTIENIILPETQNYASMSFCEEAFPMIAVTKNTEDVDFAFKNTCGVLVFQLKGSGIIKSVSIKGNSDEILSGKALISAKHGENPLISLLPDGSKTVTLDCGESGVKLQKVQPTSFYISLPPVSFENGFTITVTDISGGVKEYSTIKKNPILRSGILRMPEKEYIAEGLNKDGDYVDEYGINHGQGIEIDGVVWAPVNCGYHKSDYPYGKLYQWGRKYGQGYSLDYDASVPEIKDGGVSLAEGQSEENANVFFLSSQDNPYDWMAISDDTIWNNGPESKPVKTEYDPCPDGWRVPTYPELSGLGKNKSFRRVNDLGQYGCWFSGSSSYTSDVPQVFLPYAGSRDRLYSDYHAYDRGNSGQYWMSKGSSPHAYTIDFTDGSLHIIGTWRHYGYAIRCVQDNAELIPVTSITLEHQSLVLKSGEESRLYATISPTDANHKTAYWWSEDEDIATVDYRGIVTAISPGTTKITAMAGMQTATCEVTVIWPEHQEGDYVDHYGINHGPGIEIDGVVWAPVNCGYHESDYPYGKLYQWGRKYGQGYSTSYDASDADCISGPATLATGQSKDNEQFFYKDGPDGDWLSHKYNDLWYLERNGTPVMTEYDPCPDGWRVPMKEELEKLSRNYSSWTTYNNQEGYWFSGSQAYSSSIPRVFLQAAGWIEYNGSSSGRCSSGNYWSSLCYEDCRAYRLYFNNSIMDIDYYYLGSGYSVRCVQDDGEMIPAAAVTLDKSSIIMEIDDKYTLSATISPSNANHMSAYWWSVDDNIAVVDNNGNVTAVSPGKTIITAMAGMQTATCEVTVKKVEQEGDYVDEYGINHGQGVEIDGVVWAPVNCGYHETDYPYGKLYQWGRKYGQGYSLDYDASVPEIKDGGVSLAEGQSEDNANVFFLSNQDNPYDWLATSDDTLWNSGPESRPIKTQNDPCPDGWRVPTYPELSGLGKNKSSRRVNDLGQYGCWFSGSSPYTSDVPQVFLPYAGSRDRLYSDYHAYDRGNSGQYWMSKGSSPHAYTIDFTDGSLHIIGTWRHYGYSVRCVQE